MDQVPTWLTVIGLLFAAGGSGFTAGRNWGSGAREVKELGSRLEALEAQLRGHVTTRELDMRVTDLRERIEAMRVSMNDLRNLVQNQLLHPRQRTSEETR